MVAATLLNHLSLLATVTAPVEGIEHLCFSMHHRLAKRLGGCQNIYRISFPTFGSSMQFSFESTYNQRLELNLSNQIIRLSFIRNLSHNLTSFGISLLFIIAINCCMNAGVPTCLWKGVPHLSIITSSKPNAKKITLS